MLPSSDFFWSSLFSPKEGLLDPESALGIVKLVVGKAGVVESPAPNAMERAIELVLTPSRLDLP